MLDVSAIGVSVRVIASITFPQGFTVTEFADDADPFDLPSIDIATVSMNVNGNPIFQSAPVPVTLTLNVIPGSFSDENLAVIFEANRAAQNKRYVQDIITMVGVYPNGATIMLSDGKMTSGVPGHGVASAGRLKSKQYGFAFGNLSRTRGLFF